MDLFSSNPRYSRVNCVSHALWDPSMQRAHLNYRRIFYHGVVSTPNPQSVQGSAVMS